MRSKKMQFTNFSRTLWSTSLCIRPENEKELHTYPKMALARGAGQSYNDSCLNSGSYIINTQRFNHLMHFDKETGILECQAAVLLNDLFLVNPNYIPPVIPGTLKATIGGCIAHDVHGKNNHIQGSFGHHVEWFELIIGDKTLTCSPHKNADLFHATIGGLGLTGVIAKVGLRMQKALPFVQVEHIPYQSIAELTAAMTSIGINNNYQVAWLDLLDPKFKSILSFANYCAAIPIKKNSVLTIPHLPFSLIASWNLRLFNKVYFARTQGSKKVSLNYFNNPLDKIQNWNRLYGPKGLIQFQAVFARETADETIKQLLALIKKNNATPTLCVLKLFTQKGAGLLSFCKPGFTLAIDFINNFQARQAITAMNQYTTGYEGRIYLAKDVLLTQKQFEFMYPNIGEFKKILNKYPSALQSDLAKRLGIVL